MNWLEKSEVNIIFTFLIFTILILLIGYENLMHKKEEIKSDWANQRCKPTIIPFAGWINKQEGKTALETNFVNFTHCINNILNSVASVSTTALNGTWEAATKTAGIFGDIYSGFGFIIGKFAEQISKIMNALLNRQLGLLIPLQTIIIKIKSIFDKVGSIFHVIVKIVSIGYWSLKSFFGIFLDTMVAFLTIVVSFIVIMWIFPWTWPAAIAGTALFTAISIPLAIVVYWVSHIFNLQSNSIPDAPECFDENTPILMKNGKYKKINEIKLGDILCDNGIVTAHIKLSSNRQQMYSLHGIIVSGLHNIIYNNKWIYVKDHPNAKKIIYLKPYIYCLNTTTKKILINNITFSDWDDIDENEFPTLSSNVDKYIPETLTKQNIHKYLDSGFIGNTPIELINGEIKNIENINVNDILKNGSCVLGKIKINANDIHSLKKFNINNNIIFCTPNQHLQHLGTTYNINCKSISQYPTKLNNLITNTSNFYINDLCFKDYNAAIELFLSI